MFLTETVCFLHMANYERKSVCVICVFDNEAWHKPWIWPIRVNNCSKKNWALNFLEYTTTSAIKGLHTEKIPDGILIKQQNKDGTSFDKAVLNTSVYNRSNSRLVCFYVKIYPLNRQHIFYPCPQLLNHLLYCRNLDCSVKRILSLIPVWNGK